MYKICNKINFFNGKSHFFVSIVTKKNCDLYNGSLNFIIKLNFVNFEILWHKFLIFYFSNWVQGLQHNNFNGMVMMWPKMALV